MGKLLGIDYGTKRTGLAITDDMQIIASGLTTISTHKLDAFISDILKRESIEAFVIGDPKNLDGSFTDSTGHVKGFVKRLKTKYPFISISLVDERFTSKIARRSIFSSGLKKSKRQQKALIDKISATIILQNFLDYRS